MLVKFFILAPKSSNVYINKMNKIKILQIGMGPVGQKISEYIDERKGLEITGVVDKDPKKAGMDLDTLCSVKIRGIKISNSVTDAINLNKPDVAIITTVSGLNEIAGQIEEVVSFGIPVVSTCEELTYPWETSPELAGRIDNLAKQNNVAVVGTGVNPGFLMDSLPIYLTAVCQKVNRIKVTRIQDAATRRIPFLNKIGAGLTLAEFEKKNKQGTLRHVGLTESLQMIAGRMGWKPDKIEESLSPVIADKKIITDKITIYPGNVAGVMQTGKVYVGEEEKITLIFHAAVGETDPYDKIEIEGDPNITSKIDSGVHGDKATCAIAINAIKQILNSSPGLKTMANIPIVSYF